MRAMNDETIRAEVVKRVLLAYRRGYTVVPREEIAKTLAGADRGERERIKTIISEMAHDDAVPITSAVGEKGIELADDPDAISDWIRSYIDRTDPSVLE